jgi:hypothetical protein
MYQVTHVFMLIALQNIVSAVLMKARLLLILAYDVLTVQQTRMLNS